MLRNVSLLLLLAACALHFAHALPLRVRDIASNPSKHGGRCMKASFLYLEWNGQKFTSDRHAAHSFGGNANFIPSYATVSSDGSIAIPFETAYLGDPICYATLEDEFRMVTVGPNPNGVNIRVSGAPLGMTWIQLTCWGAQRCGCRGCSREQQILFDSA